MKIFSLFKTTKLPGYIVPVFFFLTCFTVGLFPKTGKVHPGCITSNGKILKGKVKIVSYGEDFKVRIVNYSEDLRVQRVDYSPNDCGKWQFVDYGEDLKIRFVDYSEDFQIRFVDYSPGM